MARVYTLSVSPARLSDMQRARRWLAERGFPCLVPIAASDGNDYIVVGGQLGVGSQTWMPTGPARSHLAGMSVAIEFALELMRDLARWQAALL